MKEVFSHQVLSREETQEKIKQGIDLVVNPVKVTFGRGGVNVLLIRDNLLPVVTNDGVSVARNIQHEDPFVNAGAMLVKEVCARTEELCGDGTSSSAVLTQALFNEIQKVLKNRSINSIKLKRDLEKVTEEVVVHLKKLSQKPKSKIRLREIAEISANGDKEIAELVYKAIKKVGETGVIKVEESEDVDSRVEVVDGYQLDTPFYNAGFITNHDKMTAEFSNMNVLLYEGYLETFDDLVPTINAITDFTDPENPRVGGLLILCDTIDPNTENQILNFKSLGHNFMILKTPLYGIQRTELYQDIATLIGAEVYCKEKGKPLTEVTLEGLGKVKKVVSDVNKTLLIGTEGNTSERVNTIKEQLKNYQGASKEKQTIKDRLGKLEGGVAMIYVGGGSKSDKREKTDRVDDALKAVKSCIEEGYVAGAGVTYLTIANMLQGTNEATQVMKEVLKAPFLQVYENAGINGEEYLDYVLTSEYGSGIDIDSGEKVNLFNIGVIDPTKVSRLALENAVSVVSLFTSLGASSFNSEPLMQLS